MPGTGPLRRSSVLARKKAIVGKSRVEADRFQRPWVVFVSYWLHALKLLLLGKLGGGQVAQGEVLQLCSHPVIGWQDAPPGIFGLWFIQVAAI